MVQRRVRMVQLVAATLVVVWGSTVILNNFFPQVPVLGQILGPIAMVVLVGSMIFQRREENGTA